MKKYYLYELLVKGTELKYIGQTSNPNRRLKQHRQKLLKRNHHSLHLQRYFDKYALLPDDINLVVVEEFNSRKECDTAEEVLISTNYDTLFNVSKKARGGDLVSYHPERDRIAEIHRNNYIQRIEDGMIPPGVKWGEENPNYRHGIQTKEALENAHCVVCNIVKVGSVGVRCNGCLREFQSESRKGEGNNFFGKTHSEEVRQKISNNLKGKQTRSKHPQSKKIVADGVVYLCCMDCAEAYGISPALVTYRIKKDKWDFHLYEQDFHSNLEVYSKE